MKHSFTILVSSAGVRLLLFQSLVTVFARNIYLKIHFNEAGFRLLFYLLFLERKHARLMSNAIIIILKQKTIIEGI